MDVFGPSWNMKKTLNICFHINLSAKSHCNKISVFNDQLFIKVTIVLHLRKVKTVIS